MIEHASWQYVLTHCCGSWEELGHINYLALCSHMITLNRPPSWNVLETVQLTPKKLKEISRRVM